MDQLADEFIMGKANIYGAATFYDFLRPENKGKKVYVCNGSACMTAGTQPELLNKLGNHFEASEIGEMCCLGRCHENSSFFLDCKNYSGNDIQNIETIKKGEATSQERYNVKSIGTPILTNSFEGIDSYYKLLETVLKTPADDLLNELKISGLRGRGGAGFPIAFKLESCKNTAGNQKYIVCNADEGDPGAYSTT